MTGKRQNDVTREPESQFRENAGQAHDTETGEHSEARTKG